MRLDHQASEETNGIDIICIIHIIHSMDQSPIDVRAFRRSLRALERQIERALASETECCGVTPAQCHLLLAVEEKGEPSVGELAAALELDQSTLSRTIEGLVRAGMLSRREDPANRRRQLVGLTGSGRAKADEINALCDESYAGLLASLPEEEAAAVARSLPLFAEALRAWRSSRSGKGCCGPASNCVAASAEGEAK
jgi:DNA-binding MarR family transcriptional regulator